jgi:hypothetical protein
MVMTLVLAEDKYVFKQALIIQSLFANFEI